MSEVTARKPTKKAFYFPKTADQAKPEDKPAGKTKAPKSAASTGARKSSAPKSKASAAAPAPDAVKKPARETVAKGKDKRAKKDKVVRDSFTMPKADYDRIATLKQKCLEAGVTVKKSELLRAGLQLLEASSAKRLVAAIAALETVKTGRPAKDE
ncbi:hypothetical protein [Paraburkholderia lycopersici]|uniref:Uncharacterized protein n=1 Tax=Paraburkholderia lycopersici TaxID=416944 RepID=A0A1G6UV84_9BURK|nr:hypothetical protein [Paraburkholderia lycopersici]SDD45164.1 hypothetical protein SAMN05421548_119124 [Paraburkholderia lycopersici]